MQRFSLDCARLLHLVLRSVLKEARVPEKEKEEIPKEEKERTTATAFWSFRRRCRTVSVAFQLHAASDFRIYAEELST